MRNAGRDCNPRRNGRGAPPRDAENAAMCPPHETPDPAPSSGDVHTGILLRFDDAWRQGPPPDIADFLPAEPGRRQRVLVDLVHIDLEWRLKGGEAMRVEDYLRRYPELAGGEAALLGLR